MNFSLRRASSRDLAVGIAVKGDVLDVAEVLRTPRGYSVRRLVSATLPPKTVSAGEVTDSKRFAAAVKELLPRKRLRGPYVSLCLPGSLVLIKRVTLPAISRNAIRKIISDDFSLYFPFSGTGEVYFDFIVSGGKSPGQSEVLIVTCKRRILDSYLGALKDAGSDAAIVDVAFFALQNLLETVGGAADAVNMVVDLGKTEINVLIVKRGQPLLTQDIALPVGEEFDAFLCQEMERTLCYFDSLAEGAIAAMFVTGEKVSPSLLAQLQGCLEIPVKFLLGIFPSNITLAEGALGKGMDREQAARTAVCVGSAIRAMEADD